MYQTLRRLLFLMPAEKAHYLSMNALKAACSIGFLRKMVFRSFSSNNPALKTKFLGYTFRNPVGLGAGFDKNARYLRELEALGFGFVEIGTVTPKAHVGNEKPRLFRLPADKALINRMGFNNEGVEKVAARLAAYRAGMNSIPMVSFMQPRMIIGGNIGKNKHTPNEEAWKDYELCFRVLHPYVDFFVVNVSSPNTPGLRELQEKEALKKILTNLQQVNCSLEKEKPILLKIAPDLSHEAIDDVLSLAKEIRLDGLVAANTTISREGLITPLLEVEQIGAGGLSGMPLRNKATELLQYIHRQTGGLIPLIASGGIFSGTDAREKIAAGAELVEVWTGFIYEGPLIVKRICKQLEK